MKNSDLEQRIIRAADALGAATRALGAADEAVLGRAAAVDEARHRAHVEVTSKAQEAGAKLTVGDVEARVNASPEVLARRQAMTAAEAARVTALHAHRALTHEFEGLAQIVALRAGTGYREYATTPEIKDPGPRSKK